MNMLRPIHNDTRDSSGEETSLTSAIPYILLAGAIVITFVGIGCCYYCYTPEDALANPLLSGKAR